MTKSNIVWLLFLFLYAYFTFLLEKIGNNGPFIDNRNATCRPFYTYVSIIVSQFCRKLCRKLSQIVANCRKLCRKLSQIVANYVAIVVNCF